MAKSDTLSETEARVARHYTHGGLEKAVREGLGKMQQMSEAAPVDLLAGVDEFHIGGRAATGMVAERLGAGAGDRILDIGCGLGGTARFLAGKTGARVSGIDLTPEYVETGNALNRSLDLATRIDLTVASALDLPFDAATFDRAVMLHVGMNIADKASLFSEIARVLRPGGVMVVYDVMRYGAEPVTYPVPWAGDESLSFLAPPEDYRAALTAAGLEVTGEEGMRDFAIEFFQMLKARMAQSGPPPLGLHVLMGASAGEKIGNMIDNIMRGAIVPVLMVAQRR